MNFIETRGNDGKRAKNESFSTVILNPSASFGGLYVPENLPKLDLNLLKEFSYGELALKVLELFNVDIKKDVLEKAVKLYENFDDSNNPAEIKDLNNIEKNLYISELYHGPTRAFKDMALQPFGEIVGSLAIERNEKYLILVATSGDTGPATLQTFRNRENIKVVCLYPDGGTSDVQRLQMVTDNGENLKVIGINGSFDDAQSTLKNLLKSENFKNKLDESGFKLSAANSVNFGRIIFQTIYHIHGYLKLVKDNILNIGDKYYITVPSGNFGNALGGFYAKLMGLPIEKILISSNSNNILYEFITTGRYSIVNREVINTKSPAMDILKSSNIERVLFSLFGAKRTRELMEELEKNGCYQIYENEIAVVQKYFSASFSTDSESYIAIKNLADKNYLLDTHTATCIKAHKELRDLDLPNIAYSTAEWTKFAPSVAEALNLEKNLTDQEALNQISKKLSLKIPHQIENLFKLDEVHQTVLSVSEIESEIIKFII